ncbi:MAG TPA: SusC/RagA family TonB-linked outer membrane protein, partial [Prolixibacteraceae bacterium]
MKQKNLIFLPKGNWTRMLLSLVLLMVLMTGMSFAQQKTVKGKITDETGAPVPGTTIIVKGTSIGTISDLDGNFSIGVPTASKALIISFIGMKSQEIVIGNQTSFAIQMIGETIGLEEVVAVGYGVQRKKLITGATVQVKGDDIQKMNTVSPMTAMQSQTPGVNITKTSGEPGAGFKVAIRGIGTIGNSQPLYIVDGVPRGNIDYLVTSDIESIDILKDAASAAIYGARASNGVVMVTTKKGKDGKVSVSYDGSYGVQNVFKMLPLLNAQEYLMIENEQRMNSNLPLYTKADYDKLLAPGDYDKIQNGTWNGTNWLKQMQNKNAPVQNHALNITGGNKVSTFSIGTSYTNQEGIFGAPVQSSYERYTLRINSDHVILRKDFDIIKIGENLSFTNNINHGIATGNMWWNDIASSAQTMPVLPMYAADKTDPAYPYHYAIPWNTNTSNPNASMIYRGSNISKGFNLNMSAYLELQPIKGLKYKSTFSVSPNASAYRSWTPTYNLGPVNVKTLNGVSQSSSYGMGGWMFENTLNYDFMVKGVHHFNVLGGMSAERYGLGEGLSTSNSNSV